MSKPESLFLAVRGSGQALYIGLAEDTFLVSSEPYGLVEITNSFLRVDGEEILSSSSSRGQLINLDINSAGTIEGIDRSCYSGIETKVKNQDLSKTEISTRDIDRGHYPHYLIKEIKESPSSVRATLRGRLVGIAGEDGLAVNLGPETLSKKLKLDLASRKIKQVVVIGQGTAAIAGKAVARAIKAETAGSGLSVEAKPATELSAFDLSSDMSETLVVAISQSGTTTDTNRTVELVRSRGAQVIAIVNRRDSDLTERSDGVLYTSDGRDVEMSVASTKAFYGQVVAGYLLAVAMADAAGLETNPQRKEALRALETLPSEMESLLGLQTHIREIASRVAPTRRHWAVVGSGDNFIAAEEIRIKLSEVCYKSIASDFTEDKKHIDLSAEPMIFVCANGISGSAVDDISKEVAIFKAHKAVPIVITDSSPKRFPEDLDVIVVPKVHSQFAFIIATMVGHLFGYEAARSIDNQADPLRRTHAAIEHAINERVLSGNSVSTEELLKELKEEISSASKFFFDELTNSRFDGHLEVSTSVKLASLFRYALNEIPLDLYQIEFGKVGTPSLVLEDLIVSLVAVIEELTRPIDAIKHQAKTVTVGISRSDATLLENSLVQHVLKTGTSRESLSYKTLRLLYELDKVVHSVTGHTRYQINDSLSDATTLSIISRGGISTEIPSRVENDFELRGTKHQVAGNKEVLFTRGARDGRTILLVPEVKDGETTGITLLHVVLKERLSTDSIRKVLTGYHNRYGAIRDAVCETEALLRDELLLEQSTEELLVDPITLIAERVRNFS